MPALKIYGRRWHMASDMMPIPAICGLFIHTIWLIVFAPLVAHYDVLTPGRACGRPGIQYKATCAGFLAIYAASWLGELALFIVGCRGGIRHALSNRSYNFSAVTLLPVAVTVYT